MEDDDYDDKFDDAFGNMEGNDILWVEYKFVSSSVSSFFMRHVE